MKYVTWKTEFLTLLAWGSRRGEVHAPNAAKYRPDFEGLHVILEPH
jgi:hypothetical protein